MHDILAIYEILIHILSYSEKRDLAVAARISRAWSGVALDCLWRKIDSILPLLETLSPIVMTDEHKCNFTGKPSHSSWERFQYYAPRVRCVNHKDYPSHAIKYGAQSRLFAELPTLVGPYRPENEPLLPNVQAIGWTIAEDIALVPRILPFISPSLKALTLEIYASDSEEDGDHVRQFLDGVTASPELELESFNIDKPGIGAKFMKRLLTFLERQQNLKVFGMRCDPYLEPRAAQGMLFPNLPTGLREFGADVEFDDKNEYTALIQTILQRLTNIRVLKLVLTSLGSWDLSDFESLSPFLQNPNLEELTLYVSTAIQLNTSDIHALGKALPHMVRLNIRLHYNARPALIIQVTSLMDLAKAFPDLQSLTAHISCAEIPLAPRPRDAKAELEGSTLSKLRVLDVGRSSLLEKDVARMAEFLASLRLDPLLEIEYDGKGKESEGSVRLWRDVEAMVKLLQRSNSGGKPDPDRTPND